MAAERQKTADEFRLEAVVRSINRICAAWPDAIAAAASVGYPTTTMGGGGSSSGSGDRTCNTATRLVDKGNVAMSWLTRARRTLADLLWTADATGPARSAGESRWTGPFDPPKLVVAFGAAASELDEIRPKGINRLFDTLVALGNEAAHNWPPTPKKGETIDGVKVLERTRSGDECVECHKYVAGDAGDPIRRLDGKPYHERPCYNTARQRKRRAS